MPTPPHPAVPQPDDVDPNAIVQINFRVPLWFRADFNRHCELLQVSKDQFFIDAATAHVKTTKVALEPFKNRRIA